MCRSHVIENYAIGRIQRDVNGVAPQHVAEGVNCGLLRFAEAGPVEVREVDANTW